MKRIFIGCSSEAKEQAVAIGTQLSLTGNVTPIYWWEYFKVGDITFAAIETLSSKICGAIILATPDDKTYIRGNKVPTTRANVWFEYGVLTAMLGRSRVAMCSYEGVMLPSDFDGVTCICMGRFRLLPRLNHEIHSKFKQWVDTLPVVAPGCSVTQLIHGYSGTWSFKCEHTLWRGIKLKRDDFVHGEGTLHITINVAGHFNGGAIVQTLSVRIGNCTANFRNCIRLRSVKVESDGKMLIEGEAHSRQRLSLRGAPPQRDGFDQELLGARVFTYTFWPSEHAHYELEGEFKTTFRRRVRSRGNLALKRD